MLEGDTVRLGHHRCSLFANFTDIEGNVKLPHTLDQPTPKSADVRLDLITKNDAVREEDLPAGVGMFR